ncbi:MAG: hypothetical protein LUD81_00600 [Clostridiales bacterium]|nr:hypothetical protein [Clostridiales bacterium]
MTAVKERILGAVTIMSNNDAEKLWHIIKTDFGSSEWDDIEEVVPDEWDLKMLSDIENDPDCKEFVSEEELLSCL